MADTTCRAAVPYGVATLTVAAVGVAGCYMALSSIAPITAIACATLALMGAYGFIGVVVCGFIYAGKPQEFEDNVCKAVVAGAGMALIFLVETIAKTAIASLFRRHA